VANALASGNLELQTKEMIAVAMRDVNGCEMLAALGEPIGEFLRMLN